MTVGASRAEPTITLQPALAPSPQPRPAPTARALPAEPAAQRGPFWMPIRGPDPTPIDSMNARCLGGRIVSAQTSALIDAMGGAEDILSIVADVNRWSTPCRS